MRRSLRLARIGFPRKPFESPISTAPVAAQVIAARPAVVGHAKVGGTGDYPVLPTGHKRAYATHHALDPSEDGGANVASSSTSNLPASTDLLEVYRGMVAQGRLRWDEEQVRVVMRLKHLLEELTDYGPPLDLLVQLPSSPLSEDQRRSRWWTAKKEKEDAAWIKGLGRDQERSREMVKVLNGEEALAELNTPKGILITGPPGTGKSLLLNLFFQLLPTPYKHRAHYHSFTLSLFRRAFLEMERRRGAITAEDQRERMDIAGKRGWRAVFAGGRFEGEAGDDKGQTEETIPFTIARDMVMEYHILYFDELQLLDASSAALLRDVLSWYWRFGGVIVSCSNRVPDDLYHHGVQRERMSSFLDALKARCEVIELDGGRDWRSGVEGEQKLKPRWFEDGDTEFDAAWREVGGRAAPAELSVYGRRLFVPQAMGNTCRFTFAQLCEEPLGPADYLAITSTYSTIFIDEVPVLLLKHKNEARRLINLVDAMYEARCQVFIRANTPLAGMFFPDALDLPDPTGYESNESIMAAESLSETLQAPLRPNISLYNPLMGDKRERADREHRGSVWSRTGIFTGEDERFAYKRAVSRLVEMTNSASYAKEAWIPLDVSARVWDRRTSSGPARPLAQSLGTGRRSGSDATEVLPSDDFAAEAGYSRPNRLAATVTSNQQQQQQHQDRLIEQPDGEMKRMTQPQIKEQHMWGVADEWGNKAGQWGKGAKAFEGSDRGEKKGKGSGDN